jgi:predicted nucleic acid-binding protein
MSVADRVVVDASVVMAYLLDEVGSVPSRAAIRRWSAEAVQLLVPSHFWLEATNTLIRGKGLAPADVVAYFVALDDLGLRTIEPDRPLLLLALDQMVRSGLSVYDALYLARALSTDSKLVTLDRRLADAAGDAGMLIGSAGISEHRAAYQPDRPDYSGWAHTAVVGAHIAELRRQARADN